jgi:NADH:ubiquinone oxidoreductase subunit E
MKPIKVRVCVGTNCCYAGSETLLDMLENDVDLSAFIEVEAVPCKNKACDGGRNSPVVEIEDEVLFSATPEIVMEEIERLATARIIEETQRA